MSEVCKCGHLKTEHLNIIWVKPEKAGERTLQKWVAKGMGMCSRCSCPKFRKKE